MASGSARSRLVRVAGRRRGGPARRRPGAGPVVPSLGGSRADGRLLCRRHTGAELRERGDRHPRRRGGARLAVRPHAAAVLLGTRQHSCAAGHAVVLLALARTGRPHAVSGLPRRLCRSLQLGHGVAAHRLQRQVRLRCFRHRCEPRAHPRVLHAARVPVALDLDAPGAGVGRDARHALLRERSARGFPRRHVQVRRRPRPVRPALAHHQPVPGPERVQLRARRRCRRTAHLRPHAGRQRRRRAGQGRRGNRRSAVRARARHATVARRVVVSLWLEPAWRRAAAHRRCSRQRA